MVCGFAGHGIGLALSMAPPAATAVAWSVPDLIAVNADLAPGRGLAAPPPPSQAPPSTLS
jgi:hypothetical protein